MKKLYEIENGKVFCGVCGCFGNGIEHNESGASRATLAITK